ncbi:hypothetical protein JT359_05815 [Candidatus Poribacteria bacterium]|nr:hypothetical protein [Candidatus Poribacteria bacterium]
MAKKESCHLMDMLAEVIDSRNKKGLRPRLFSFKNYLYMCVTQSSS